MSAHDNEHAKAISNELSIHSYLHCNKCLNELPPGTSPREWAQLEVGFTKVGLQVWCRRHECNVVHIDFEGQQHPANVGISGEYYNHGGQTRETRARFPHDGRRVGS